MRNSPTLQNKVRFYTITFVTLIFKLAERDNHGPEAVVA